MVAGMGESKGRGQARAELVGGHLGRSRWCGTGSGHGAAGASSDGDSARTRLRGILQTATARSAVHVEGPS
jgi:hypothetical protein